MNLGGASQAGVRGQGRGRQKLPFRSVNRPDQPDYRAGMQRHHLLPRQLLVDPAMARLFDAIGRDRIGYDDFRLNGLLLPSVEQAAQVLGLPLHRGPHRHYNAMVAARMGQIEAEWARACRRCSDDAAQAAVMRMKLLQRALRRSLLQTGWRRIRLNRRDPFSAGVDFSALDAMADELWASTEAMPTSPMPPPAMPASC